MHREAAVRPEWAEVLRAASSPVRPTDPHELVGRALLLGADVTSRLVGCSLTVAGRSGWTTPQASNAAALALDLAQYDTGTGPCIDAASTGDAVQLDDVGADPRFTAFDRAAVRAGVGSSLSLPLPGAPHPSGLNLYATGTAAFDSRRAYRVADLLARAIAALLTSAPPDEDAADDVLAKAHGAVVRDGVAVLARTNGSSEEQAYHALAARSRREGRPILLLARELLEGGPSVGSP